MKKIILLAAAFGLLASGTVYAIDDPDGSNTVDPGDGITGSKHDLSDSGISSVYPSSRPAGGSGEDPLDRICIWCHAPHHSMVQDDAAGIDYLPLWNHEVTHQFYTTYKSDFGDGPDTVSDVTDQYANRHVLNAAAGGEIGQPGSVSRLCLSCHDGSVAVNEYGRDPQRNYSRSTGGIKIAAQFTIGGTAYGLLNHHPIGFNYADVADADDEINPASTAFANSGKIMTISQLLYDGKMECVTCHDVHNSKNDGETFLWISDENSAFCLTCHEK